MKTCAVVLIVMSVALCLPSVAEDASKPPLSKYQDVMPKGERQATARGSWSSWSVAPLGRRGTARCPLAFLEVPQPQTADFMADRLGLTDAQKPKLKTALEEAKSKIDPLQAELTESMAALRKAAFVPDQDGVAIRALVGAARTAEDKVVDAELSAWLSIKSMLTEDQLKTLHSMMLSQPSGYRQHPTSGVYQDRLAPAKPSPSK